MDFAILNFIQEHVRNGFFDWLFPLITRLGNGGFLWIAIGVVLLFWKRTRKYGVLMLCCLAAGALLGEVILKNLVERLRPFHLVEEISLLIARPGSFSFPSGHSWSSFCGATVLWKMDRRLGAAGYVLAVLIAFSRLYLYVHFLSDVLAGSLFGVATALLGNWLMERLTRRRRIG